MRYTTAFLLASVGLAAAQSATDVPAAASTGACGQQIATIISSCLSTTKIQVDACTTNDWDCLCNAYTQVLTCYNNCPSDPNRFGVSQTQVSYCNAAKAYGTAASASSTASGSSASGSATSGSATSGATTASGSAASSASARASSAASAASSAVSSAASAASSVRASASATASAATGAAGALVVPVGGFVAGLVGVVGLL